MGTGHLSHEQDDSQDHEARGDDGGRSSDHPGECLTHHAAPGSHHHQKECPQQLGEQTTPFLTGIIKVADPVEDALFVSGDRAARGEYFNGGHGHTFRRMTPRTRILSNDDRRWQWALRPSAPKVVIAHRRNCSRVGSYWWVTATCQAMAPAGFQVRSMTADSMDSMLHPAENASRISSSVTRRGPQSPGSRSLKQSR